MTTLVIDPTCSTCHGSGKVMGGDEYQPCPSCRIRARYEAEQAWRDLRDAGTDELTLRALAGDR